MTHNVKHYLVFPTHLVYCACSCDTRYDHLVAIERTGRAKDGNYYNMRGVNIKHLVDPIDNLFIAAKDIAGIITTGNTSIVSMPLSS